MSLIFASIYKLSIGYYILITFTYDTLQYLLYLVLYITTIEDDQKIIM